MWCVRLYKRLRVAGFFIASHLLWWLNGRYCGVVGGSSSGLSRSLTSGVGRRAFAGCCFICASPLLPWPAGVETAEAVVVLIEGVGVVVGGVVGVTLGVHARPLFGLGLFLGALIVRQGFDAGCVRAELLAIDDTPLYHGKCLVATARRSAAAALRQRLFPPVEVIPAAAVEGPGSGACFPYPTSRQRAHSCSPSRHSHCLPRQRVPHRPAGTDLSVCGTVPPLPFIPFP